jgi:plastocyanin
MKKLVVALALLALVPFALAACGGDDDGDEAPPPEPEVEQPANGAAEDGDGATTLQVTADPDGALEFEQESLTAPAGEVTIDFENASSVPHDVVIEDSEGNDVGGTEVITGGTDSVTLELEPGDYTFYCSVPGHREAGMEGPMTVE